MSSSEMQAQGVLPTLTVDDVGKSLQFFEALGFVVEERWEHDGELKGAMVRAGAVRLGIDQDDWKKGRDRRKGVGMRLFVETQGDIDELAARAKAAGIALDGEPHDAEWGSRMFDVTEPSGFKLTFTSPIHGNNSAG